MIFLCLDERLGYELDHNHRLWFMWLHFEWFFILVVLLYRASYLDLDVERIDEEAQSRTAYL